jgi:hypothetical protein
MQNSSAVHELTDGISFNEAIILWCLAELYDNAENSPPPWGEIKKGVNKQNLMLFICILSLPPYPHIFPVVQQLTFSEQDE